MAKDASFDVVSDYDLAEMTNAVDQAQREIMTRFDFKGTAAKLEFAEGKTGLQLEGESDNQLRAIVDVLQSKLIKRGVSLKVLDLSDKSEEGRVMRWKIPFKKGLDQDKAKKITKLVRDHYPKVKTQIQGDAVRVSSSSRDDLQAVIALLKEQDFDFPLQFENYR
jgi:cyclic-di-GMP-binding protein